MAWSNGRSMSLTYDALDRLVLESYGGGAAVTAYGYDGGGFGIGRLTSMSDSAGSTSWTFDAWGNVLVHSRNSGARSLVNRYAYDAAGRPASLTYPSGAVVSQSYDAAGRVSALTLNGTTLLGSVTWQPFGAPQSWIQGNGRSASKSFDIYGRMTSHPVEGAARTIAYDAKGRIVEAYDWQMLRNFSYDAADRLTADTRGSQSWSWTYDANGNRLSQSTSQGASASSYLGNRIQAVTGQGARTFGFDAAGNLTSDGPTSYAYDHSNRLTQAAGQTYGHDGTGLLVSKSGSASRYWAHDLSRRVLGEYSDSATLYEVVWLGATPVAVIKGGVPYWIDADHLDTPRAINDASNNVVWRWASEAFGNSAADEDPIGLAGGINTYGRCPGRRCNSRRRYEPSYAAFFVCCAALTCVRPRATPRIHSSLKPSTLRKDFSASRKPAAVQRRAMS